MTRTSDELADALDAWADRLEARLKSITDGDPHPEGLLANVRLLRGAAAALRRQGVPEGWKLVPTEPTIAMDRAFWEAQNESRNALSDAALNGATSAVRALWKAMLAAAPEPPTATRPNPSPGLDRGLPDDRPDHPIAWRVKDFADRWIYFGDEATVRHEAEHTGAVIEELWPLPRNDVAEAPAPVESDDHATPPPQAQPSEGAERWRADIDDLIDEWETHAEGVAYGKVSPVPGETDDAFAYLRLRLRMFLVSAHAAGRREALEEAERAVIDCPLPDDPPPYEHSATAKYRYGGKTRDKCASAIRFLAKE